LPSDAADTQTAGLKAKVRQAYDAARVSPWYRALRRTGLARTLLHTASWLRDPAYRVRDRQARAEFERFVAEFGGAGLGAELLPPGDRKTALVHHVTIPYAGLEAVVQKALQAAGYECVSVGARWRDFLRFDRLAGNEPGYLLSDYDVVGDPEWVREQMTRLTTTRDWLELRYEGVRVGRFVLASALRLRRAGQMKFGEPEAQKTLATLLDESVRNTIGAIRLLDDVKPSLLLMMDRGYSGAGELFDAALARGIDTVTWNFGYKSNRLAFKRYNPGNDRDHPLCPSKDAWERMLVLPPSPAYGEEVRAELFGAYESQDWFSAVGTQFDRPILSREATRRELGLRDDKKIAVVFPHILWDGSFFYGQDLFEDYTEWLAETIKAACANDRVQWVVKLHPAHVVKAERENYRGKPAELVALEGVVDKLPPHITLIQPDAPISSYSLIQIADFVVTVRGTVGIEAALHGVPVLTAGTGRYDRRGFTIDSKTTDEYLRRLAEIETCPPLTADQVERAEKYAYYLFLCRPLRLSCASIEYARDRKATPILTVRCRTPEEWRRSPDVAALAQWFRDGVAEDFVGAPIEPKAADAAAPEPKSERVARGAGRPSEPERVTRAAGSM
jgi:hypothetical protein